MKKLILQFIILVLIVLLAACSFSATTANYTDLKTATEVDANNNPVGITSTFNVDTPLIYVTGMLNNAPKGTMIKAEWYYLNNDPIIYINEAEYESVETTTAFYFNLSIPDNGWPVGNYEVMLYIDGEYKETVAFSVE